MLGETATQIENDEEAIKAFNKAYQLDSTHLPSLLGLAASYYRAKDWERAFKFYQMLLVHHRDSLGSDETTDIFFRLGVIKREQGERRKALNMFDKALEEDAYHRPTLEAVVGLYQDQKEWEQVIHFKKQILEVAANDQERFDLLDEIGDLWKDKVKNTNKAIQAYSDAADIRPEDHKVLHKLLIAYQETKQWNEAIEVIQRISDLDERDAAKSKYAYTVAVIIRDELKDAEAAIDKFNEALDLDSSQLKAFEAINKILTQKKDWKQLERAFRKMLHRIMSKEGNDELKFNLWHNLGVIYRDRQQKFDAAAEAFKMASGIQPDNALEHQILAELYSMIPERIGDAINEHQWLLRQDPYRVDSYRALYRLYFDARAYDKAWCLAATLTFLKKADAEQQQFYEQYKQGGMIRPQSRIDNERWVKDLFHPDEDLYVAKIFEATVPAVHAAKASTDKALHLSKKHEVDPATSTVTFARTFGFVSQVLNLSIVPRLFLRPDAQGGLTFVPGSNPPASVCGASLLSGFSPQDLTFVIGRHVSYYRGEHFIRTLLSTHTELRTILLSAMAMAGVGPKDPQLAPTMQALQSKLGPAQFEAVRTVAKRFVEAGGNTDLKRWMQAVELTGCRAGFLLCNDLETAARMIQSLPPEGPTDLPPKEKIKEIVLFSVSEEYFRLRESLGIQIQV
jgi:tetratricopeptide (TPR) repeat protein